MRWPKGDPDAVARDILAQPAYRHLAPAGSAPPKEAFSQVIWDWVVDHILRPLFGPLLHGIGHAITASKGIGTVFGFVLIGLALAGLAFVIVRLAMAFLPRLSNVKGSDATLLDAPVSQEDWRKRARDAAARGDYRGAIGALFAAALALLDDRAVVAYDAARTPGEYRRLVRRARDAAAAPFDVLADRFVRATYAERAPEREDFDAAEGALEALEPAVRA